ncbi:MAG: type I-G CRISPR-associated protein, Cas3-extension family [Bacilli bacterium]
MAEFVGNGPRGGHLLGYMTAVGALSTMSRIWPTLEARLGWLRQAGWRPVWSVDLEISQDELVAAIAAELVKPQPAFTGLGSKNLGVDRERYRSFMKDMLARSSSSDRKAVDFAAAFATDGCLNDDNTVQDTAFRTLNGTGHQHFLGTMQELLEQTKPSHVEEAMFGEWRYEDRKLSMRWDDVDLRQYAYRATNPTKSSTLSVRGANRLAVEAMVAYPVTPTGANAVTVGTRRAYRTVAVRWPIWDGRLTMDTVKSLLCQADLSQPFRGKARIGRARGDEGDSLRALGILEVYESVRLRVDRYRTFGPSDCILGDGMVDMVEKRMGEEVRVLPV